MVKKTDFSENTITRGTLSVLQDQDTANGNGSIEVEGEIYTDFLRSNDSELPVDLEEVKFKEKKMTMTNTTEPGTPSSGDATFYMNTGFLKSKSDSGIITTYQPTISKGDLLSHNGTTQIRVPASEENYVLTIDSSTASGLKWVPMSQNISRFSTFFTLVGKDNENSSIILYDISGTYFLTISTMSKEGPMGIFFTIKISDDITGNVTRIACSPSIQTIKHLDGIQLAYEEFRIFKYSQEGDGVFTKKTNKESVRNYITLSGTSWVSVPFTSTFGAYNITISSDNQGFPNATYLLAKSNLSYNTGNIIQMLTSPGQIDNCRINIRWQSGQNIQVQKTTSNYDGQYFFIDNMQLSETTTITLSGTTPVLFDRTFLNIYERKSIVIRITKADTYPCALIFASKNVKTTNGTFYIVRSHGHTTLEKLFISWLPNNSIRVYKDGSGYDGDYTIEIF